MKESIYLLLLVVVSCQMCCNPARRTVAEQETDGKDSSSVDRVFISDRLQDSLENFLKLVDTTDYCIISKAPGKYIRHIESDHFYKVVTLCCFTNDSDTTVNFYGAIDGFVGFPASIKMRKVFIEFIAAGAKSVNNTIIAVNSYGNIAVDSVFDSLFLSSLDLELYWSTSLRSPVYCGNVFPFFKEYIYNGDNLELVFTNEKKVEYLDTVKNIKEVFR